MINDFLNQYVGYTYKQNLVMQASKAIMENKKKIAPGSIAEACLVTVHEKGEIKSIGAGIPLDIINDNYGLVIKEIMSLMSFGPRNVSMTDSGNTGRTVLIGQGNPGGLSDFFLGGPGAAAVGANLQVGSGSTPATRSDFNIETAFGTSPESTTFGSLAASYNASLGLFTYGNSIVAGASGTIREACTFGFWLDSTFVGRNFLITRDLVSPIVSFIMGENIAVDWTWQL